jgi:RNA polymerase sigma-32 factor
MQAAKRFEPDRGFRFATYAMWWIRASIQQYILRSWSLVKLGTTASQRKLFFKLRAAKSRIAALEARLRPDQVALIAQRLGVAEQEVVDMDQRLDGDVSLNTPLRDDGGSGERQDWLVDEGASQEAQLVETEETQIRHTALRDVLRMLSDRERCIFIGRRLVDDPLTLEALAEKCGVSRERVRQIEIRAFQKVQKAMKNCVALASASPVANRPVETQPWLRLAPRPGAG